eukprot:CAMPEP_0175970496 /NCGR_PEP_ID=MMETSP0108-20121206/41092_1 /TAXON_ID=195067 ORGANISM="Goniomonas pacifica, Strain CCMP1869" /NCGR_SAMPLE_ID=MMETSP0108 /ASSEMBLY_ACC=CAM_ASM_000204 /LENGTH=41 /DNA_ID= /DNA_START= /DNA_END= /DNA_ORIENTATION=
MRKAEAWKIAKRHNSNTDLKLHSLLPTAFSKSTATFREQDA